MNFLLQAKINQIKMCVNRGYLLSEQDSKVKALYDETEDLQEVEEFYRQIRSEKKMTERDLRVLMSTTPEDPYFNDGVKVAIMFLSAGKKSSRLNIDDLSPAIQETKNNGTVITIIDRPLGPKAQEVYDRIKADLQIFYESELQYDLIESVFVPLHKKCTQEETANFYAQTGASTLSIPIMLKSDKVSRYYGFQTGDLVKIFRDYTLLDMPVAIQLSYRIVV